MIKMWTINANAFFFLNQPKAKLERNTNQHGEH